MSKKSFFEKKWNSVRKRLRIFAGPILARMTDLVVIEQKGGLASQLGLYVVGEYLRTKCGRNVAYDLSWFETCGMSIDGKNSRKWELENLFELNIPRADPRVYRMLRGWRPITTPDNLAFPERLITTPPPFCVMSEQANPRWFYEMSPMLQELKFKASVIEKSANSLARIRERRNSCAVHVRRGDYIGSLHEVCGIDYFVGAVNEMRERLKNEQPPKFFIFSNGFDWVKENLLPALPQGTNFELMEENDNDHMHGDFYLMSNCRHQIVSNSGFSWLSSLLGKEPLRTEKESGRIIIEPSEWIRGKNREPFPGHIALTRNGKIF